MYIFLDENLIKKNVQHSFFFSVKYDGILINHSKKQTIDLKKYYENSLLQEQEFGEHLMDLIPFLTEMN